MKGTGLTYSIKYIELLSMKDIELLSMKDIESLSMKGNENVKNVEYEWCGEC